MRGQLSIPLRHVAYPALHHAFGGFTRRPGRRTVTSGLPDQADSPRTGAVLASRLHAWRRPTRADDSPPGQPGVRRSTG
ncbi:hypothetical protein ACWD4G_06035 [Streptomyces sp. NPDC002643]